MMDNYFLKLLSLIVGTLFFSPLFAAQPVNIDLKPYSYLESFTKNQAFSPMGKMQIQLITKKRIVDFNRMTHVQYIEIYGGFPILFGNKIVQLQGDEQEEMDRVALKGVFYDKLDEDLKYASPQIFTPGVAAQALSYAIMQYQHHESIKYAKWERVNLIVYIDKNYKAHWAFLVRFNMGLATPAYILDAMDFSLYQAWDSTLKKDKINQLVSPFHFITYT